MDKIEKIIIKHCDYLSGIGVGLVVVLLIAILILVAII